MSAADLLAELKQTFPAGATSGTFDAAQVQGGEYVDLLTGLGIPTTIELTSAAGWQSDGTNVMLSGTADSTMLGIASAPVYFQFTPNGSDWVMVIDLDLPSTWTFGQSFPLLSSGIFSSLTPESAPVPGLVVASGEAVDANRPQLPLAAGLTFSGQFAPSSSALSQMAWILEGGAMQAVAGPIVYDVATGAVAMQLALAEASLGKLFGSSGPTLDFAISLYSGLDAVTKHYEFGVRFDVTLANDVDMWALIRSADQPLLELMVTGLAVEFPSPDELATYFGAGNTIAALLPAQFNDGANVQVSALAFGIGLHRQTLEYSYLSVAALADETWKVWPGVIVLSDVTFSFVIFHPFGDLPETGASFGATFDLGEVPIVIQDQLPGDILTGGLDPTQPAPQLGPLVAAVFGSDRGLPQQLEIAELTFSANIPQSVYSFDLVIDGDLVFAFGTDNEIAFETLTLDVNDSATAGVSGAIAGSFTIDKDNVFAISLDLTADVLEFKGAWHDIGTPLTFQDIAIALGMWGLANLPPHLDLGLKQAELTFDSKPTATFTIETAKYGRATLVGGKNQAGTDWGFVYGMEVGLDLAISLTDIPLLGNLVPSGDDIIALKDLRIVAATQALPAFTPTTKQLAILGGVVSSGLVLSIELQVADETDAFTVRFGGSDDGTANDTPPPTEGALPAPQMALAPRRPAAMTTTPPTSAQPGPQAHWVDIQRAFGPVQMNRIGFGLTSTDDLALMLDAGVALDGLSITLNGLAAEIPLKEPFWPTFGLAGLDIQYTTSAFTIGGGLDKVPGKDEYTGELELSLGRFGATVMGEYAKSGDDWSLFVFAFIQVPLGGPGFFFVNGLSGGFGYNTSLALPTIDTVANYPLVEAATGTITSAQDTVNALAHYIAPEQNEDWLAAGISFTSYDIVKSYALVTVAFGPTLQIGLMGQSTITVPPSTPDYPADPVAQAELELLVDIDPTSGVVAVCAQLSPTSYVFTPSAKLTGGFAFYVWFDPSPNAGEFVITLGGYNPYFTPPSYYPQVPLLGLNWQICSELTAKGGLYFALTPSVIMAGGSFDATWDSFGIKAWFDAQADFLIRYKPFTFGIDMSINVGASITVDVLVSVTVKVQAGGALDIWGPPVGGHVSVDLEIFSVDFGFGAGAPPSDANIDWDEFQQSFLPPTTSGPTPLLADNPDALPTNSIITVNAPTGLTTIYPSQGSSVWGVSAGTLTLDVALQIPATSVTGDTSTDVSGATPTQTDLGVGPMGVAAGGLAADLSISFQRDDGTDRDQWVATGVLGTVPSALWQNTSNTMQTDGTVSDATIGLTLVPSPPSGQSTTPVAIGQLLADDPPQRQYSWSDATVPQSDDFDQATAMSELQTTLVDPTVAAARTAILTALSAQGMTTAATVDVSDFARDAPDLLFSAPSLRYLGEVPVMAA